MDLTLALLQNLNHRLLDFLLLELLIVVLIESDQGGSHSAPDFVG